jgi:hypothetical protein
MAYTERTRARSGSHQLELGGPTSSGATETLSRREKAVRATRAWAWAGTSWSFDWMDWHDLSVAMQGVEIEM